MIKKINTSVILLGLLLLIMLGLFLKSFNPDLVIFSNDGPLGLSVNNGDVFKLLWFGDWVNLYWLGSEALPISPGPQLLLYRLLDSLWFAKLGLPIALIFLGLCASFLFKQLGFPRFVCILGGLVAALNGNFFSNGAWGLISRPLMIGSMFLTLAFLVSPRIKNNWLRLIIAGGALGLVIVEGYDAGAILSLYAAAFTLFLFYANENKLKSLWLGSLGVALLAVCAALMSYHTLSSLINTQVTGTVQQQAQPYKERWDFATQWSLPKTEALRVVIPGLFGYRMDSPDGKNYWGEVGQTPDYKTTGGIARYSGAGEYAGIVVVLFALYALFLALNKGKVLTAIERKHIYFWSAVAGISLLLSFGRHFPLYQYIFQLPGISAIRNPIKFMYPFHIATIILFGYGLLALSREYLTPSKLKGWVGVKDVDKHWVIICCGVIFASCLGGMLFNVAGPRVLDYLQVTGFNSKLAERIFTASLIEVALAVMLLSIAGGLLVKVFRRELSPAISITLLGLLLFVDLCRANLPWIEYVNYKEKLAPDAITTFLANKPYEGRVTVFPFNIPELRHLQQYYGVEWLQHKFPYYKIQALDVSQEARKGADKQRYEAELMPTPIRYWELTGTRWFLGLAGLADVVNNQLDGGKGRFKERLLFAFNQSPAFPVAVTNTTGPYALIEFTGALPRVALYTQWVSAGYTEDTLALATLKSPTFNPAATAVIRGDVGAVVGAREDGKAEIIEYTSRKVVIKTDAKATSLLLLNDRYSLNWKVTVDGEPRMLQKCNYIVRGALVPQGQHTVKMTYMVKRNSVYVSLASLVGWLGLLIWLKIK